MAEVRARHQRDRDRGNDARRTANPSARSARRAPTQPAPTDADTNCRGVNPTPACCSHTRLRSARGAHATRRRGRAFRQQPAERAPASSAQNVPMRSAASSFTTPHRPAARAARAAACPRAAPGRCAVRARRAARPSTPAAGRAPRGRRSARTCGRRPSAGTTAAISMTCRRTRASVPRGDVVAVELHDEVERVAEHLAHDPFGDVLARHQRRVHQRVERLGRAVGVDGAEEPAAGVDRTGELERFGAAHLADDDHDRAASPARTSPGRAG